MKLPFTKIGEKLKQLGTTALPGSAIDDAYLSDEEIISGLSDIYVPENSEQFGALEITNVLLDMGKINADQHTNFQKHCRVSRLIDTDSVEAALLKKGIVNLEDLLAAKAKLYNLEFRHITADDIDKEAFEKLYVEFIKNNCICPIAIEDGTLVVATPDPANVFAIEEAARQSRMSVRPVVCSAKEIESASEALIAQHQLEEEEELIPDYNVDDIIGDMTDVEVVENQQSDFENLEEMAGQSPVIKFVNYLISNAIREGASDIHIEPKEKSALIKYRIDGALFEAMQAPLRMHPAVVSRIKIMSNLNISERRLPQDGKISVIIRGRRIDLRISTLPTNHGEKVVIRVLDSKSIMRGLDRLGMTPSVCEAFGEQINSPHGIVLVTGPTGSGKSTTLYSALSQMDGEKLNVSTVEDPVEYELDFCNQVQANEAIGLTFAVALRSLLRQDPDIIMIGEIRDPETAKIAVQAALTGHLVLSTLHTNDASSSITRLVNIGVDSYLIAAALNTVLAQRLVRKICDNCKQPYSVPKSMRKYIERAQIAPSQLLQGKGCEACRGSGYVGRVGIYELLIVDDKFRTEIGRDASVSNMRQAFHQSNQPSLFDDGLEKVKQGLTTIEEILRVAEVTEGPKQAEKEEN